MQDSFTQSPTCQVRAYIQYSYIHTKFWSAPQVLIRSLHRGRCGELLGLFVLFLSKQNKTTCASLVLKSWRWWCCLINHRVHLKTYHDIAHKIIRLNTRPQWIARALFNTLYLHFLLVEITRIHRAYHQSAGRICPTQRQRQRLILIIINVLHP